jgi:Tfp pilus assembly protein PilN
MRINLNLSTTPLENHRRFVTTAGVIGLAAIIALGVLAEKSYSTWRANRAVRADITRIQTDIRGLEIQQKLLTENFETPEAKQVLDRSAFLNSLIEERTFPWPKVFEDLEHTLPGGVRIVTISPRLEGGRAQVKLTFAATDDVAKVKFIRALEASKAFSEIHIEDEKYSDAKQGQSADTSDRIIVTLQAWYSTT